MKKMFAFIFMLSCASNNAQSLDELWKAAQNESNKGNYDLADSLYSKAIKIDFETKGKNFGLYYNRGICRYELNQLDLAIHDFESCLKIYPYYSPAYREKAKCYYRKRDYIESRLNIDKCYSINKKDLDNLVLGIMTCIEDTNVIKGKDYVKKAKDVNKDDRVYGLYSILLNLNMEHEKAYSELQIGIQKFPTSSHIYEGFIFHYYLKKDYDSMSKYVNLIASSFPYMLKDDEFRKKVNELRIESPESQ